MRNQVAFLVLNLEICSCDFCKISTILAINWHLGVQIVKRLSYFKKA